jgi:phosphatidylglycerophosphate synthase
MPPIDPPAAPPALVPLGSNDVPLWGMTAHERLRRIAAMQRMPFDRLGERSTILSDLRYVFDPAWTAYLRARPGTVLTRGGEPVVAHVENADVPAVRHALETGSALPAHLEILPAEREEGIFDEALRKRERPFAERLVPANVPAIERASYVGAYKGVTDLLTKYLWPEWAFQLTRLAVRIGLSPNGVTAIGTLLCIAATVAFWHGWFWTGLATGLAFMVLDTVDGKLARCTITSSRLGNAWDHGVDLIHPPIWWWAWATGCAAYGRPLSDPVFAATIAALLFGYVAQRSIEGAFILRFGMHIHVWRRFDSRFRLVTARRNPNMVILFALLIVGRPDWGIVAVAGWTMISLAVHLARLVQAVRERASGGAIVSWLA